MKKLIFILLMMNLCERGYSQDSTIIHLWPGKVPGSQSVKHEAVVTKDNGGNVTRLTDVTDPIMTVFTPEPAQNNGAAILICPGGAYQILAIDLEGYEIAHWLTKQGFTAFVLQYRVPDKQEGALQDAQRAMRVIRSRAVEWKLDPGKIGVMGFSAGGSLSARISTRYNSDLYNAVDVNDSLSAKPDFALLIYPAYLDLNTNNSLTEEINIDSITPPMFLFQTADDPYGNSSIVMTGALRKAKVPVEFHLYPNGGHGYGLRAGNPVAEVWPILAAKWLQGILMEMDKK